jgi:hypothetical protein
VEAVVETVSIELAVPPPLSVMFAGLRLVVGPDDEETVAVRNTVPAKLLMLVTMTVDVPVEPAVIVMLVGLADIVKSGFPETTANLTVRV